MAGPFLVHPIGTIHRQGEGGAIELERQYQDGLLGLADFSHIVVCYWFDQNDTPESRRVLQVHPRGDASNPLTGVFATHSPRRPNLIAISICKILSIQGTTIRVDRLDARDGSPVIDIKCYIPSSRPAAEVRLPAWVSTSKPPCA